jgi:hypothetical protein
MDSHLVAEKTSPQIPADARDTLLELLTVSRQFAIDIVSFMALVGVQPTVKEAIVIFPPAANLPHGVRKALADGYNMNKIHSGPGYIYAPLRVILFSDVVRSGETRHRNLIGICNTAADDVVDGLMFAWGRCNRPDRQNHDETVLINNFGQYLPQGVTTAWRLNKFDTDSSSCTVH